MMATQRFDPTATEAELTTVTGWQAYLHEVAQYLRPSFARRQSWQRAVAYIEGLLSSTERKNAWQLAEVNGDATPYGIQHLLDALRGSPTNSGTPCMPTWWRTSATPTPCWWWMRRDFEKKATSPPGSQAVQRHGRES